MADKLSILRQYFGYGGFRKGQSELIDAILTRRDVLGIMPTGGGKSLCYQVPALMMEGVTIVISPLISLMKDQVSALTRSGIPAAFINSSLTAEQTKAVYRNMAAGKYKLIYVAPERLETAGFVGAVTRLDVAMVAVDEAHCISQWGQDFRPSYLKIVDFLKMLPKRPVVAAFTATATQAVRDDIERILSLRSPFKTVTGFDRPNLYFEVQRPHSKPQALERLVKERNGKSGIVYCSTRKDVEKVCDFLCRLGCSATRYHAGLSEEERSANQEDFVFDRRNIMVATNAFGMGIDKSNVAYVIHYNMPASVESYYQEAGRAGRDGSNAECILLYNQSDIRTARFLIEQVPANDEMPPEKRRRVIEADLARLDIMAGYCKTGGCLRGYILNYFGQDHDAECHNCSSCNADYERRDMTRQAQMILSCVRRIEALLGYNMGIATVIRVLRGSKDGRVIGLGLDKLTTYGLMADVERSAIRDMIDSLEGQNYVRLDDNDALVLTERAANVLFRGEKVTMAVKKEVRPVGLPASIMPTVGVNSALLTRLKAVRFRISREENVPAYVIFTNTTLTEMARKRPTTMDEMLKISGVGDYKAGKYGRVFIEEIRASLGMKPLYHASVHLPRQGPQ